ncbi:MAG: hypothetical protein V9H26_19260 [Verrucomicrobiota bacterium]
MIPTLISTNETSISNAKIVRATMHHSDAAQTSTPEIRLIDQTEHEKLILEFQRRSAGLVRQPPAAGPSTQSSRRTHGRSCKMCSASFFSATASPTRASTGNTSRRIVRVAFPDRQLEFLNLGLAERDSFRPF